MPDYPTFPCPVLTCLVLSCPALPCPVLLCPVLQTDMDHMEKSPAFRPAIKDVSPQLAAKLAGLDVIGATHSQHNHSHSLLFHLISRYALFLSQPYAFLFESLSPTLPYLIAGPLQSVRFSISHHTTQHNTTKLLTAHPSSASACYSSRLKAFVLANSYSLRHPHQTHTHTHTHTHRRTHSHHTTTRTLSYHIPPSLPPYVPSPCAVPTIQLKASPWTWHT